MYSFVRSYFTLTDIPQYAASSMKGDCGVQALLFITLCRETGIPARWQARHARPLKSAAMTGHSSIQTPMDGVARTVPSEVRPTGRGHRDGISTSETWIPSVFRQPGSSDMSLNLHDPFEKRPYDNQMGEAEYGDRSLLEEEYSTGYEMISLEDITY
ncbi:MAG: transglutaminase-like domain-containing protein [Enterocloster clostridioformis]